MDFKSALSQAQAWINEIDGVESVAEGLYDGKPCITVFVSSAVPRNTLPDTLGEWKIVVQGANVGSATREPKK